MKSAFRLYARTSKPNDPYLHQELLNLNLKPRYEDLMHAFYFPATFTDIFNLSFHSLTAENLYVQLGHKFPLKADYTCEGRTNEDMAAQFFRKINFANFIPMRRGIVENISLNILVRESSSSIPSENVLLGLLKAQLDKLVILREYKQMGDVQGLPNYYDIKQIVHRKWEHQDRQQLQQREHRLLPDKQREHRLLTAKQRQGSDSSSQLIASSKQFIAKGSEGKAEETSGVTAIESGIPYQPHFVLYIRRNHARLLLKLNQEPMYKHGWKKNIGWGPIRQSLVASLIYRTGILSPQNKVTLWDPFCGSGTIPLVACSMFGCLRVRQDSLANFVWPHWPIYKASYLQQYLEGKRRESGEFLKNINIVGSDIDYKAINNSLTNFGHFLAAHQLEIGTAGGDHPKQFLNYKMTDQVFELLPNKIYLGVGDFEEMAAKLTSDAQDVTILTNLPYLGERSKDHIPLNQLKSLYIRFNKMVAENSAKIRNVFVVVNADGKENRSHFLRLATEEWRIMGSFQNGGIEVNLLAWAKNKDGWGEVQPWNKHTASEGVTKYDGQKSQHLEEYRQQVKSIDGKQYEVPKHLVRHKEMRGYKRILEKRKARHLRAAYLIFAKRKDKDQAYSNYAQKELALKLSQRGKSWKRKNMGILNSRLEQNQEMIKEEFEKRIEQALLKSQQKKQSKKGEGSIEKGKGMVEKRKW